MCVVQMSSREVKVEYVFSCMIRLLAPTSKTHLGNTDGKGLRFFYDSHERVFVNSPQQSNRIAITI